MVPRSKALRSSVLVSKKPDMNEISSMRVGVTVSSDTRQVVFLKCISVTESVGGECARIFPSETKDERSFCTDGLEVTSNTPVNSPKLRKYQRTDQPRGRFEAETLEAVEALRFEPAFPEAITSQSPVRSRYCATRKGDSDMKGNKRTTHLSNVDVELNAERVWL